VERSFETAQDRLVKGMRRAGACTLEEANRYLEQRFLPWWEANCTVQPACPDDAHRPLAREHDLVAILSYVESRKVVGDYTFRLDGEVYRIEDVVAGLRGNRVRVERRRDGTLAIAFRSQYLRFVLCPSVEKAQPSATAHRPTRRKPRRRSTWMDGFDLHKSPPIWTAT
jgi:hypothetical protein